MKAITSHRASTKKTGKLVSGSYLENETIIVDKKGNEWDVKKESVQSVLCYDVNGVAVFEGDEVKSTTSVIAGPVYYGEAALEDGQLVGAWFFKGIVLKIDANLNCKTIQVVN